MNFDEPFILFSYPIISSHLGVAFLQALLSLVHHSSHLDISEAIFAISPKQALGLICSGRYNRPEFNWKSPHNTIHVFHIIAGLIFINTNSPASRESKLSACVSTELPWVRLQGCWQGCWPSYLLYIGFPPSSGFILRLLLSHVEPYNGHAPGFDGARLKTKGDGGSDNVGRPAYRHTICGLRWRL